MRSTALLAFLLAVCSCYVLAAGEAVVSVKVTDENGGPIPAAEVSARWHQPRALGSGWGAGDEARSSASADDNGHCSIRIGDRFTDISAVSTGYYRGGISADALSGKLNNTILALNRPSVEIRLKKIINPVPMYVKRVRENERGKIPAVGVACGFDFIVGDWVSPHGAGLISDLLVTMTSRVIDNQNWQRSLKLSFTDPADGLIRVVVPFRNRTSEMRLPQEAPVDGYQQEIIWEESRKGDERLVHDGEDDNYIFRIRRRPAGQLGEREWMYGKVHGPVRTTRQGLEFTYYLNPTGSRSLEWDRINNLFGKLPNPDRFFPEP